MRDQHRRQRRRKKLRALKTRLAEATTPRDRARLIEKLKKISLNPERDIPKA